MTESQNIQIPLVLFNKLVFFLECLNLSPQSFSDIYDFQGILSELRKKQQKINIRTAYSNTICSRNDAERNLARMNYLKLKSKL
jgi:hypothetical protein